MTENVRFIAIADKNKTKIKEYVTNTSLKTKETSYIEMVNKMMASPSWTDETRVYTGIKHSLVTPDDLSLHFTIPNNNDTTVYIAITSKSYPARVAFKLLDSLTSTSVVSKKILQSKMTEYCNPSEHDKITKVNNEVENVRIIMSENISSVLSNTEALESVEEKSLKLNEQAKVFRSTGKDLSRRMWMKNIKMNFILALACALVIILLLAMAGAFSSSDESK